MASVDMLLVAYPWLRLLGSDVLPRLDVEELADPHVVGLTLGPTVVAYRRGVCPRPDRVSLCSIVPVARVSSARAAALAEAEQALRSFWSSSRPRSARMVRLSSRLSYRPGVQVSVAELDDDAIELAPHRERPVPAALSRAVTV